MRQAGRVCALGRDEHDGPRIARRDEALEQRRLHGFNRRDDEPTVAVGHVHGAPTAKLVDRSIERKCCGVAVDFLLSRQRKAFVSRVLGYQLASFRSAQHPLRFNA